MTGAGRGPKLHGMDKIERIATACGPLGVVLMLAGNGMAGTSPGVDAPAADVSAYLAELDPAWAGAGLEVAGLLLLLVFAAALSRRAGGTWGTIALASGAAGVAVKLATAIPLGALWLRPESVDPAVAGLVLDVGAIGFAVTGALLAALPAAAAACGILPRWLTILAGLTVVALLVQVPLFRQEFGLGFLLLMIWTVATGLVLLRGRNLGARAALQPA